MKCEACRAESTTRYQAMTVLGVLYTCAACWRRLDEAVGREIAAIRGETYTTPEWYSETEQMDLAHGAR